MKYDLLINKIMRLPLKKAIAFVDEYQQEVGFQEFSEQQRVLDVFANKDNAIKMLKEECFQRALMYTAVMTSNDIFMANQAFQDMKKYPYIVWQEILSVTSEQDILTIIRRFSNQLSPLLLETFIVNLSDDKQVKVIGECKDKLKVESDTFYNFYYAVGEDAKAKLRELYDLEEDDKDFISRLKDLSEDEFFLAFTKEYDKISKLKPEDVMELVLLKTSNIEVLNKFIDVYKDLINNASSSMFKLFFKRYCNLRMELKRNAYSNTKMPKIYEDYEFFHEFENRFHEFGIEETFKILRVQSTYGTNKLASAIILDFLDIATSDFDLFKFINEDTIIDLMEKYTERCNEKEYSLEEFEKLVKNVGVKDKIIYDDYIEAIVACGQLLKKNEIDNKNELFLELREKVSKKLLEKCERDQTYNEDVSLNALFYRLAKGTITFDEVFLTKTYKGLIYLTKCGHMSYDADYITRFLTDEQMAKLNISPVIKWRSNLNRTNTNADNNAFIERMGIQLLCYFGKDKAKYLLESDIQGNRMEHLFDGLDYKKIAIDDNGNSIVHEELVNFLFGKGMMKEPNSVINRMIRRDIPEFERYFTVFCNTYDDVYEHCKGILTVKRIYRYFNESKLPIDLKPNEYLYRSSLAEMNTTDEELLKEGLNLCVESHKRQYSTIPKVKGTCGNFRYEILDLNDPMALAVGYLSHCCFVVQGISDSALRHSMLSENGRTFVVYDGDKFLTQSWVWRNGDVVCFDSVEAGCPVHGCLEDKQKLVEAYKSAAQMILTKSQEAEDEVQQVKVVTVGKSDFLFEGLDELEGIVPKPLEKNLHIYDSLRQWILAGKMPEEPRYDVVGANYKDPLKDVIVIEDIKKINADDIDNICNLLDGLRYEINGIETSSDYYDAKRLLIGDGWYILVKCNGYVEKGILSYANEERQDQYERYIKMYGYQEKELPYVKKLNKVLGGAL